MVTEGGGVAADGVEDGTKAEGSGRVWGGAFGDIDNDDGIELLSRAVVGDIDGALDTPGPLPLVASKAVLGIG